jgi:two-component system, chemotaxis family, response regulator Rcp1
MEAVMSFSNIMKPIEILLVEDNPGDIRLCQEALKESKLINRLNIVMDGEEAMNFVRKAGQYENAPSPDLVLLDLNLPKKDGREVLMEIKSDEKLRRIPVVVMTVSSSDEDILRSYDLHANCYITEPVDFERFIEVVKAIENFWFTIVRLPSEG